MYPCFVLVIPRMETAGMRTTCRKETVTWACPVSASAWLNRRSPTCAVHSRNGGTLAVSLFY